MQSRRSCHLRKLLLKSNQGLSHRFAWNAHPAALRTILKFYRCFTLSIAVLAMVACFLDFTSRSTHLIDCLLSRIIARLLRPTLLFRLVTIAFAHLFGPIFRGLVPAAPHFITRINFGLLVEFSLPHLMNRLGISQPNGDLRLHLYQTLLILTIGLLNWLHIFI